jgi:hypothetical protein
LTIIACIVSVGIVGSKNRPDILVDQEEGGHADRETDDIEGGESLVAPETAEGDDRGGCGVRL